MLAIMFRVVPNPVRGPTLTNSSQLQLTFENERSQFRFELNASKQLAASAEMERDGLRQQLSLVEERLRQETADRLAAHDDRTGGGTAPLLRTIAWKP